MVKYANFAVFKLLLIKDYTSGRIEIHKIQSLQPGDQKNIIILSAAMSIDDIVVAKNTEKWNLTKNTKTSFLELAVALSVFELKSQILRQTFSKRSYFDRI